MWLKLLGILTLQFAFLLADGMAQNAGMRCDGATGANKSRCLKTAPPRGAADAMSSGGKASSDSQSRSITSPSVRKRRNEVRGPAN